MAAKDSIFTLEGQQKSGLLAPEMVGEIFKKVQESSVVAPMCGTVPMGANGSEYVIATGEPEADIVGEGMAKPVSTIGLATKVVKPVKAAVIVPWSKEARLANPASVFDTIQEKMSDAIRRQVDYAILYGKSAKSDKAISGVDCVNQTTNRVTLGTATAKQGGLSADVISGYTKVMEADSGDYDFSGFVADPRLRSTLLSAVDDFGRPLFQAERVNLADSWGSIMGLPAKFGKVVSGRIAGHAGSNVRAFGGDFAGSIKLGFVENITVSMSNEATIQIGSEMVSLWSNNLEAALVEAIFGWVIESPNAFVAYEQKATTSATS